MPRKGRQPYKFTQDDLEQGVNQALVKKFAGKLTVMIRDHFKKFHGDKYDMLYPNDKGIEAVVIPGKKYTKVDVKVGQQSGKFMVGPGNRLFFVKGYGTPDLKKYFGKLENIMKAGFKFDGYSIHGKNQQGSGGYGYGGQIAETKLREIIRKEIRLTMDETLNESKSAVDLYEKAATNYRKFYDFAEKAINAYGKEHGRKQDFNEMHKLLSDDRMYFIVERIGEILRSKIEK